MRKKGVEQWDRMGQPVSHLAAVVGGVSLIVLLCCGWMMVGDSGRMVRSVWWWGVTGVSAGMLGLAVVAYVKPGNWSGWVVVLVVGVLLLWATAAGTYSVGQRFGVVMGLAVGVVFGLAWFGWVGVKVKWLLAERINDRRGFEVGEGRRAVDER